jgi:hypothetical protein
MYCAALGSINPEKHTRTAADALAAASELGWSRVFATGTLLRNVVMAASIVNGRLAWPIK